MCMLWMDLDHYSGESLGSLTDTGSAGVGIHGCEDTIETWRKFEKPPTMFIQFDTGVEPFFRDACSTPTTMTLVGEKPLTWEMSCMLSCMGMLDGLTLSKR